MGLDIKIPIGLMFAIYGIAMTIFGVLTNGNVEMYKKSLDTNINIWSGVFMLVFGGAMLIMSMITRSRKKQAEKEEK